MAQTVWESHGTYDWAFIVFNIIYIYIKFVNIH